MTSRYSLPRWKACIDYPSEDPPKQNRYLNIGYIGETAQREIEEIRQEP